MRKDDEERLDRPCQDGLPATEIREKVIDRHFTIPLNSLGDRPSRSLNNLLK